MPCNCSKEITWTECQTLKWYNSYKDMMFIYHINSDGLLVAFVPKGENPNNVARQRNFLGENGNVEWYHVREHPCIYEDDRKTKN